MQNELYEHLMSATAQERADALYRFLDNVRNGTVSFILGPKLAPGDPCPKCGEPVTDLLAMSVGLMVDPAEIDGDTIHVSEKDDRDFHDLHFLTECCNEAVLLTDAFSVNYHS